MFVYLKKSMVKVHVRVRAKDVVLVRTAEIFALAATSGYARHSKTRCLAAQLRLAVETT